MDFSWADEEVALRASLRSFVEDRLMPGWTHVHRDMPTQATIDEVVKFCKGLAERDLLTPQWPEEFGGRGVSPWSQTVISEEMWGVGEPRGPQYTNVNWIGPAIMELGTEEQQAKYIDPMSRGEAMWCQGFSEPDAGSDLAVLRTSARREGDVYVVNGQKIWTSYAAAADHCFLLVRTEQHEDPRRGISILLVPMSLDGIEVREIPTLGHRHLLHEVFFDDVAVPSDCLLGAENEGWSIIRGLLTNERVGIAYHEWIDRTIDALVDEAVQHDVDTEDPRFLEIVGRAGAWTAASRVLNYVAVQARVDGSEGYTNLAATYRASKGQMELGVAHAFVDVLGAEALLNSSRGDYQVLAGTYCTIGGGAQEMDLNTIARRILRLPREK